MKTSLKLEEAAMFGLSIFIFLQTHFSWWLYPALILLPDIGMLGYLHNNKTGAFTYNLFHHKGIAIVVMTFGFMITNFDIFLAGNILFGHASMDRMFGYGLKYNDSFHHTHLGWLKKPEKTVEQA